MQVMRRVPHACAIHNVSIDLPITLTVTLNVAPSIYAGYVVFVTYTRSLKHFRKRCVAPLITIVIIVKNYLFYYLSKILIKTFGLFCMYCFRLLKLFMYSLIILIDFSLSATGPDVSPTIPTQMCIRDSYKTMHFRN